MKIDGKKNTALLDLNPFFYPPKAIDETAKAFKGVCSIKANSRGNRLVVELKPMKKASCEEIALNFLNYALSLRRELS